jgi:hypothetical protein
MEILFSCSTHKALGLIHKKKKYPELKKKNTKYSVTIQCYILFVFFLISSEMGCYFYFFRSSRFTRFILIFFRKT